MGLSCPFSLAVARLHCPASLGARSFAAWVGGRAGWVACPSMRSPAGLPLDFNVGAAFQDRRARTSALRASVACAAYPFGSLPFGLAQIGVLGAHPPSAYSPACARQFGYAFGQTPAHLVCSGCSPRAFRMSQTLNARPPETRKVSGYAPCLHSSFRFNRLSPLNTKWVVLADPDKLSGAVNFLFVGCLKKKIRTDKLFSLHSFIAVTWFVVYVELVASFRNVLLLPRRSVGQGALIDLLLAPSARKISPTLGSLRHRCRAHPNKTLLHCAPFLVRKVVVICGFLPPATLNRDVARRQG